ncbi:MAG TPA: hypothetical protein VK563_14035 [Puia sp.]|nr:hypothetical protein [Puia sp.]
MKKRFFILLLTSTFFFMMTKADAQFRRIPGTVTDSFKLKYPAAKSVEWEDGITSFKATFILDNDKYTARYSSKGEWQGSQKKIKFDDVPVSVKDGLSKSKYAGEWKTGTVTARYLPRDIIQYNIVVYKGDLQKKNLLFSSEGQLLKDSTTL